MSGCLLAAMPARAAEPVLRFALGQAWSLPFAKISPAGELQGGLLFELMEQIAANAGARASYTLLPPKRVDVALERSLVDLHCLLSPAWMGDYQVAPERWTVPLLTLDDVLLAPPGHIGERLDLSRGAPARVGLVLSYHYPGLEKALASGRLLREDAPTQERVLEKLARGRTDYAVANSMMAAWFNKRQAPEQQLEPLQVIDSVPVHCLLAVQPALEPARIQAAVRQLAQSGQLKSILARYR
jgi:polar amino acid transport system substrate-binding protein